MPDRIFSGVIAPVLTPFGSMSDPDPDRFVEHAGWLLDNGCSALAPFGTTSEANSLGLDERMELLEELIDAGIEPSKLMPGTGSSSTTDAAILTQHAIDTGCGGVLLLPPFYYKQPSEDGIFQYYADVIDEVADDALKVYLYHIPQMTGVPITLTLIDRLRKEFPDAIAGMKDSSGDWANMQAVMKAHPDLEFFPGSESFLLPALKAGAAGVISANANINCRAMQELIENYTDASADGRQTALSGFRTEMQAEPLIPLLKGLVAHYRGDPDWANVRPPFTSLSTERVEAVRRVLEAKFKFTPTFVEAEA